jgi:hypothetical protein
MSDYLRYRREYEELFGVVFAEDDPKFPEWLAGKAAGYEIMVSRQQAASAPSKQSRIGEVNMKLFRILLALIIPTLILIGVWFTPDSSNAQYPGPATATPEPQIPVSTPWPEGLSINYSNCHSTSIEWNYRVYPIGSFYVVFTDVHGFKHEFYAPFYWGNSDVEYWVANYNSIYVAGKEWSVQAVGSHPDYPGQPVYYTDSVAVDCTGVVPKSRVKLPMIRK